MNNSPGVHEIFIRRMTRDPWKIRNQVGLYDVPGEYQAWGRSDKKNGCNSVF
jgi:hypothetical protein